VVTFPGALVKWRLALCAAIVTLAVPLAHATDGFSRGPILCPFRLITGMPCPTCGTTRAIGSLLLGNVSESVRLNPLGLLLVITTLWFIFSPSSLMNAGRTIGRGFEKQPVFLRLSAVVGLTALGWIRAYAYR